MARPSCARIDLGALRHNYAYAKALHGGRALAVIKANGYGHGAVPCAMALAAMADGYAVACLEEALTLRAAGVAAPILLLEGVFEADELELVHAHDLWVVVHHQAQLRMIEASRTGGLSVWLKVDSGMHRAGFAPLDAAAAHERLLASGKVADIVLMTHFARADEREEAATTCQIAEFDAATANLPGARSLCNSAGLLAWPAARRDWARPGIMLYGANPLAGPLLEPNHSLKPVMTLESHVFAVRTLRPGDALGYGGCFVARQPTRVGLVAVGYADGYPRSAPSGTPVAIEGRLSQVLGRVSMDMLTVDLTALPDAGSGSRVELWGAQVDVNQVAAAAGTIAYELLCNVKRVPLVYV
ncbi:MAG: alanine racemase [Pseudomonadales bacterium]|jgi:alanine racemase|nr:alanine racemase [Pseudomonadales bacterium]